MKQKKNVYRYDKIFGLFALMAFLILVLMIYFDYGDKISSMAEDELSNVTFSSGDVAADEVETGTKITKDVTVVLNAQLGGSSNGGTAVDGSLEKNQNLEITLLIKSKLEDANVNVVLTRDSDEYVSESERVNIANSAKAALVVSIGRNEYNSNVSGVESWIYSGEPMEAIDLSNCILNKIASLGYTNRGIKAGTAKSAESDYAMNEDISSTSCVLLLGFLSSSEDNTMFTSNEDATAAAIADGIVEYLLTQGY